MKKGRLGLQILTCACTVAVGGALVEHALAVQKKPKEPAPSVASAAPPRPSPEHAQKPEGPHARKTVAPPVPEQQPEVLQRQVKQTPAESKPAGRKGHRQAKVSKKISPKAEARPRTDLMYHGILEGPSRYEPRRDRQTAGPPDPQTSELAYEHFQELDRNGDGSIDPVERAFGRLDMDHDLSKRQR